jgi:hypothetical protein
MSEIRSTPHTHMHTLQRWEITSLDKALITCHIQILPPTERERGAIYTITTNCPESLVRPMTHSEGGIKVNE